MEITDPVEYTERDGIALVTLSRPQSRNALSSEVMLALTDAFARAVKEGPRAVVVTGAGRSFCAGGDLASVHAAMAGDVDREIGIMVDQLHGLIQAFRDLPQPTVAAVNGAAVGAGVALALAADVRVLGASASFVTGYVAVGASPDGGASFHLARALGGPRALSSFLLNRRFTASELASLGLADEVVEEAELTAAAVGLADRLGKLSFPAVRSMRELVYAASGHSLQSHLDAEKAHFLSIARTAEFRDAVAPFARV